MEKAVKLDFPQHVSPHRFHDLRVVLAILVVILFSAFSSVAYSQSIKITGTVYDENGNPLPGTNILVEGTSIGTITTSNGNYSIEVPGPGSVLLFSFIGYISEKILVEGKTVINMKMIPDLKTLEDVVVVGYGTQKKVNLSGAVDVVTSKQFENRPVTNVGQALQGLSPNMNISVSNDGGEVGSKMNINIRGVGSINGGQPYVLVDGIEQDITNINPDDIQNISVLKDAASSSIYGARAAFGVILITTKKGRNDGISVNYSNNFSFATPTIVPHPANSLQFADYFNAASANDGSAPMFQKVIIDFMKQYQAGKIDYWTIPAPWNKQVWLSYNGGWANTDWYKESYKSWVPNSTHSVSVSGGDKRTQFYLSGSTFNQEGLLKFGNDSHVKNTLNLKLNTNVTSWLRVNFLSKYTKTNIERPSYDRGSFYYDLARQWPTNAPYYPDGSLAGEATQIWLERGGRYNEGNNEYTINPGLEIEPVKGWVIFANYRWKLNTSGITNHESKVFGQYADGTPAPLRTNNSFAAYQNQAYYNSPNIYSTYNKKIGNHEFTIMAGFEQELTKYNSAAGKSYDLINDDVPSLMTATGRKEVSDVMGQFSTRSFFGRLNYNYKEKYLFEFATRYDGSSKFPDNFRWGTFPSASAAYVISKEGFWNPDGIGKILNMLKARTSYGSLGNQNVANYLYIERLSIESNPLNYIMGNSLPYYSGMANLVSPNPTWEKVNTLNFGLDAGFLNNRLNASFDYFIRNTFDMLGPAESLPLVLGAEMPKSNNATLNTKGFEFVLEWKDKIGDFSYNAKFMLSDAVSTVTRYNNPQKLLSNAFYEGARLGDIWGFTTVGLFKSDAEAAAADQSYLAKDLLHAGDVEYKDINTDYKIDIGKNTLDDHGDLSIIGNSTPRYAYSFALGGSWKGIDISTLWQGIGKRDLALGGSLFWGAAGFPGGKWWSIGLEPHMDYWTNNNTDAYWPAPHIEKGINNHQVQTRYLQNGAYLRLKSVQIGYNLPSFITKLAHVQNFKIYVSGENLLTFTKLISIFDPEETGGYSMSGAMYPLQKTISAGINLTF